MREPRFHPDAELEYNEAIDYFDEQSAGLGSRFCDEVEFAVAEIVRYPKSGAVLEEPVRKKVLRKFPYSILYVSDGEGILVVAVMHQHRRPGYWTSRLG